MEEVGARHLVTLGKRDYIMAIKYNWTVPMTEYDTATGGIKIIHWRCDGTDETTGTTGTSYGTTSHEPDLTAADFIPYADVTEAAAVGWAKGQLDVAAVEQSVANRIYEKDNPPMSRGKPWAA